MGIRTLLIDNYDSYSYNLYQLIAVVNGEAPTVVYNDQLDLPTLLHDLSQGKYHNVVISPGPGTPEHPQDIGICLELFKAQLNIPILGVCLGHQALALAHGARVVPAPEPVHGRLSSITHIGHPLFNNIPSSAGQYQVVRYHSLIVEESSLPECLEAVAWTCGEHHALELLNLETTTANSGGGHAHNNNGVQSSILDQDEPLSPRRSEATLLMGLAHTTLPYYGVQYHPESVATEYGQELLQNFKALTCQHYGIDFQLVEQVQLPHTSQPANGMFKSTHTMNSENGNEKARQAPRPSLHMCFAELPGVLNLVGGSEGLFTNIVLQQSTDEEEEERQEETSSGKELLFEDTFWLDSAALDRGRFSFMGPPGGPLWRRVAYNLPSPSTNSLGKISRARNSNGNGNGVEHCTGQDPSLQDRPGTLTVVDSDGGETILKTSFWPWLESELQKWRCCTTSCRKLSSSAQQTPISHPSNANRHGHGNGPSPLVSNEADSNTANLVAGAEDALSSYSLPLPQNPTNLDLDFEDDIDPNLLPFNFWGGYVGYLGYELKAESGGEARHIAPTPDAAFFLADRFLAIDHTTGSVYVVALHERSTAGTAALVGAVGAKAWVAGTAQRIKDLAARSQQTSAIVSDRAGHNSQNEEVVASSIPSRKAGGDVAVKPVRFKVREGRSAYLDNIAACMQALHAGDSYEVCLTTSLSTDQAPDPWALYQELRRINPAPYAAWLNFGPYPSTSSSIDYNNRTSIKGAGDARAVGKESLGGLTVCCSSPERFLRGERGGRLEAKPIKGTARRVPEDPTADAAAALALQRSEKDRAENLMIVDLLRNDLSRVCEVGSVKVPALMQVESFATVHQLVSTVTGMRRQGMSVVDCIRAAFPGGSMTGAPKVRTMQIIDGLETGPRGIYSGSLGYISFNDTFDLNIVIRSAIIQGNHCTIGAGGAIVAQSEPEGEWEEMRLKCAALLKAVGRCCGEEVEVEVDAGEEDEGKEERMVS